MPCPVVAFPDDAGGCVSVFWSVDAGACAPAVSGTAANKIAAANTYACFMGFSNMALFDATIP